MYSLTITQRQQRKRKNFQQRKNNQNAFERWRIQVYIHGDLHCLVNIINQPNKSTQVIMHRIKRKQYKTDRNIAMN